MLFPPDLNLSLKFLIATEEWYIYGFYVAPLELVESAISQNPDSVVEL
jgi:hypothetical protein